MDIAHSEDAESMSLLFAKMLIHIESARGRPALNEKDISSFFERRIIERLQRDDCLYLVVRDKDGTIVAALEAGAYQRSVPISQSTYLHIHAVYVEPASRRQGIATVLMNQAMTWGRARRCTDVELNVVPGNSAAMLYESLGFQVIEQKMGQSLEETTM